MEVTWQPLLFLLFFFASQVRAEIVISPVESVPAAISPSAPTVVQLNEDDDDITASITDADVLGCPRTFFPLPDR